MTHFIIYVKQAPLLNVYVLFLCMYTIYILIILKNVNIAIDIVPKLKS